MAEEASYAYNSAVVTHENSPIRGASDDVSPTIQRLRSLERLRSLIADGTLPRKRPAKVFGGPTRGGRVCVVCAANLLAPEIEFEITNEADLVVYFHRRCFDLWLEADDIDDKAVA